ncbi:MAG TPA: hypothetical protein VG839_08870 [Asticcacaulis sp.]|nr:hypothetical protein [Asticcacaulis sp.]
MPLKFAAVLMVLAIATPAAADTAWVATEKGVGLLTIGMTVDQAGKAVGAPIKLNGEASNNIETCATAAVPGHPYVELLFEHYRLSSVSFGGPSGIATSRGITNGATEAQVHAKYTPLEVASADYDDPPAHNLTWWAQKDTAGIRFRTSKDGKVRSISVGAKAITYMEACL